MKRTSTAIWQGSGKEGKGHLSTQSTLLNQAQYSYTSRFEEGIGTNPEELIAAAHAGCFSMKLSFVLGAAGFTPDTIETKCIINLVEGSIIGSHLIVEAKVPAITDEIFASAVNEAKLNCPVSKALNTEISVEFTLKG